MLTCTHENSGLPCIHDDDEMLPCVDILKHLYPQGSRCKGKRAECLGKLTRCDWAQTEVRLVRLDCTPPYARAAT
eukprot:1302223-Amphidinium_carterae.2